MKRIAVFCLICAALIACQPTPETEYVIGRQDYETAALTLTDALLDRCCDWTDGHCGLLTHCTASYHDDGAGRHTNITYGDYFLVEALAKLNGTDPMLWVGKR